MSDRKYRQRGYQDDDRGQPAGSKRGRAAQAAGAARPADAARPARPEHAGIPRRLPLRALRPPREPTSVASRASAASAASTCTRAFTARRSTRARDSSACEPIPARVSPEGRRQQLHALRAAREGRARDGLDAGVGGTSRAQEGVRRSVQVLRSSCTLFTFDRRRQRSSIAPDRRDHPARSPRSLRPVGKARRRGDRPCSDARREWPRPARPASSS